MTNEEAINELLFAKRDTIANSTRDKALDKAIEALKDKLPKKPIEDKGNRITEFKCPQCRDMIAYKVDDNFMFSALLENNICRCGQEIDWSETNE